MFDLLSRDIKKNIKMIPDPVFAKQLPTIRKDVDSKGRLKIESKEDYKNRTGETSPDEADSFALCNFARYYAIKPLSIMDIFNR
jgi:stage III sporulation protein SpoIIIAA